MNSFNKTEAAIFPMQTMLPHDFHFSQIKIMLLRMFHCKNIANARLNLQPRCYESHSSFRYSYTNLTAFHHKLYIGLSVLRIFITCVLHVQSLVSPTENAF